MKKKIYDLIYDHGKEPDFPFKVLRHNIGTLSGNREAYYAALSANYLSGHIDTHLEPYGHKKVLGALDMGGSSTQIVFKHLEVRQKGAFKPANGSLP